MPLRPEDIVDNGEERPEQPVKKAIISEGLRLAGRAPSTYEDGRRDEREAIIEFLQRFRVVDTRLLAVEIKKGLHIEGGA